ncbi:unnamed protein product [Sphagnum troendelagicum]|uniref:L-ascorbate oxidase n=1 Tax=Sphagnum troendelagicum TaxID=128251 RepID=A0ABP0TZF9_9BRYO
MEMELGVFFFNFVILVFAALSAREVEAAVRYYEWSVDYAFVSLDCVEKLAMAINGQIPGPRVDAVEGDTVVVKLTNNLPTEGVVIHWHGIRQFGTPYYDGAASASQCPINSGETFTYTFVVDQAGTYFYHGHFGMQRSAGLYGSIIVSLPANKVEPFHYDEEISLLLSDWWHKSMYEQELGLHSIPPRYVGEPQSLLIEGRGKYNCSLDECSSFHYNCTVDECSTSPDCIPCWPSNPECDPHVIPVHPGKTYRLRLANVASLSALNFILEGHTMTVVMADGHYIEPFEVSNLDIYSGQSYCVLFNANRNPSRNYWAAINVRGRDPTTPTGLAIVQYLPNSANLLPPSPAPVSPAWNDFAASTAQARKYVPRPGLHTEHRYGKVVPKRAAGRTLILLLTQNKIDGYIKWAVNNVSFVPPATPLLAAFKFNLKKISSPPDTPPNFDVSALPAATANINASYGSGAYVFKLGETVDVIIQNGHNLNPDDSDLHPWHLHGHHFWVLGYGNGKFDSRRHSKSFNLINPPLRNTVPVFPFGWSAIRFVADNPGVWPFHCHIEEHFAMGMGVMFAEGVHQLPKLPPPTLGCGLTKPTHL